MKQNRLTLLKTFVRHPTPLKAASYLSSLSAQAQRDVIAMGLYLVLRAVFQRTSGGLRRTAATGITMHLEALEEQNANPKGGRVTEQITRPKTTSEMGQRKSVG